MGKSLAIEQPPEKRAFVGISEQVASDLSQYLDLFSNRSFAIRNLSKETGLNEKTIKRLLALENKPSYQSLFKLYSIFLNENSYKKLISKCPKNIAAYLEKYTPCESIANSKENSDFLDMIKKEPLMAELYVLAGTGPIQKSAISWRYGQYGLELLLKLEKKLYIKPINKDTYVLSEKAPNLDGNALKFLGEYFVQKFSKPENTEELSQHTISFYAEGLNEEGKKEWLAIDTDAFYKKLKIANNPAFKGKIPVFTFTATDTAQMENKYV